MADPTGDVTLLLRQLSAGAREVDAELFRIVYQELRRLAGHYMRSERQGHTLQPTALVHEAYAAIVGGQSLEIKDRAHFMALASRAMRRVLVDHARARASQKRDHQKVALHGIEPGEPSKIVEILAVNEALDELSADEPLQARITSSTRFSQVANERQKSGQAKLETSTSNDERERSSKGGWWRHNSKDLPHSHTCLPKGRLRAVDPYSALPRGKKGLLSTRSGPTKTP